jgi:hypothetical protein
MVKVTTVENTDELQQVIDLSKKNMVRDLSASEIQSQGFVTMQYTLDALQQMHSLAPSVVAKDGNNVVGYALVLPAEARSVFPPLEPLFVILQSLNWNNKPVTHYKFYIMGQVCIEKEYRALGLFDRLYEKHRELFSGKYDFVITEISTRNFRSMRAHERVGFRIINTHRDELDEWAVVLWDWT